MLVTVETADAYMATRYGAASYWTELTDKAAALATAERQLAAAYSLPTTAGSLTDLQLWAICEQALFLLRDPDIDARLDLQAQGVKRSDLDGETYAEGAAMGFPIAPAAAILLAGMEQRAAKHIGGATPTPAAYDPEDENQE